MENKLVALFVPFCAQAIILSDAVEILFPPDVFGTIGLHLAYWGALLFSIAVGIGGIMMPELVRHWDRQEQLLNYVEKPHIREIINRLGRQGKKTFLNDTEKKEFYIKQENNSRLCTLKILNYSILLSKFMLVSSSAVTAARVGLTIIV